MKLIDFDGLPEYSTLDHIKGIWYGKKYISFFDRSLSPGIGITVYDGHWFYCNIWLFNFSVNY